MVEQVSTLKEVKIQNSPINVRKDTINYDVKSFTGAQDKVLGDVLKKMPGIEVSSSGQIMYQGSPIQQLTVNGLNLMEGRYGLITNNIPTEAVSKVQVVENDQPIKILDSLMASGRTSINIKLKKFTTTGSLEAGVGMSPFLRTLNLTPMMFNKNFQTVQTFMSNNIGVDGSTQLRKFSSGSGLDNNEGISELLPYASVIGTPPPPFGREKWLDNNINLIAANTLQNLKNGIELKTNLGYINDSQRQFGNSETNIFTGNSVIRLSENKQNINNINEVFGGVILGKNTKKIYLRNNLSVDKIWNNNKGYLINDSSLNQYYDRQYLKLDNRLTLTTQWGKQLIFINSQINYASLPENLSVTPGVFSFVLNKDSSYQNTIQQLQSQSFSTSNSISIIKKIKKFVIVPKLSLFYNSNSLTSGIQIQKKGTVLPLDNRYSNDIQFIQSGLAGELQTNYEMKHWTFKINVPGNISTFHIRTDSAFQKSVFIFQPRFSAEYKAENGFKFNYTFSKDANYGNMENFYGGYILRNYRTLQKQSAYLPETITYNNRVGLEYKDVDHKIFFNFSANHSVQTRNILYNTSILPDGTSLTSVILSSNKMETNGLSAGISKFVSGIKTLIKLDGQFNHVRSEQLINGSLTDMNNRSIALHTILNGNFFKYIIPVYEARLMFIRTEVGGSGSQNIQQHDHHLELNIFPVETEIFTFKGDYYASNLTQQPNSFFLNASYRHKFKYKNKNADFELRCNNLANTKYYNSFYNVGYMNVVNSYQLRERQVLLVFHCSL